MKPIPRAGLLPMYLQLYDDALPEMRKVLAPFLEDAASRLARTGVEVLRAPICRKKAEFEKAVGMFEREGADCIVTLHLAYSPSLESIDALAQTALPIVILDTTMDYDFSQRSDPGRILYNHGIHGVQDMASMLRRRKKPFAIAAGHVSESSVLARTADLVRAGRAARHLRGMKVLLIGESFPGMGDFAVGDDVLRNTFGVKVVEIAPREVARYVAQVNESDVRVEMSLDEERFVVSATEDVHRRSVRLGLGLRRLLAEEGCGAFSMNFLAVDSPEGTMETPPFLEASKAMARGIGYAGEGDVLTAALVGALGSSFGETTFTEIFCPDWCGDALFLSHMGEINPEVAAARPTLCEKEFPFTRAKNPAVLACAPRPGSAVLVNLAPGPDDSFDLIVAPVEVLSDTENPAMRNSVRGWVRPRRPIAEFLEEYSRRGGTHHSALVLGELAEAMKAFADFASLGFHQI